MHLGLIGYGNIARGLIPVLAQEGAAPARLTVLAQPGREAAAQAALPAAPRRPLDAPRALPLARPGKIVCLGLNYSEHAREGGYAETEYPSLFLRLPQSLVPHGVPLERPLCSERFDYEAELMVVIGTGGRHIPEASALDHVFGYTLFNDGSLRDYQRKATQWTPGKNFDRSGSIGPDVVTPDELPAGAAGLRIQSRLNGRVMQDANTGQMLFGAARTIAIVSQFAALEPGDLIALGTPEGVGHARKPPVWMAAGDTIEVEIEGIGRLENGIVDETP
ncbi:MAG: fumarylacetoacetate hydrolase family protein [Rhodobacteraceae bacterium]|nr:fumarylacetoacetate hydrolase family protein [Paracoccaceae bacterium]